MPGFKQGKAGIQGTKFRRHSFSGIDLVLSNPERRCLLHLGCLTAKDTLLRLNHQQDLNIPRMDRERERTVYCSSTSRVTRRELKPLSPEALGATEEIQALLEVPREAERGNHSGFCIHQSLPLAEPSRIPADMGA